MNRRERKKEKTRASIINCAIEFFKSKGFHETSMEEIAEKTDVSKCTIYNYFKNKESILVAYFQYVISNHSQKRNESFKQNKGIQSQLEDLLDFINRIFRKDIELVPIYFRYRLQTLFNSDHFENSQRSGLEGLVLGIIKEAQANKEIRYDIPLVMIVRNFMFLYVNFFVSTMYDKEIFNINILKK